VTRPCPFPAVWTPVDRASIWFGQVTGISKDPTREGVVVATMVGGRRLGSGDPWQPLFFRHRVGV